MTTKRVVNKIDLFISGGLVLIIVVASLWAAITPQIWNTGMIVSIVGAIGGFSIGFVIFIAKILFNKPTYITKQGTYVWIGSSSIPKILCEKALDFFVKNFTELYPSVTEVQLQNMLNKTNIIFSKDSLNSIGKGYYLSNNAGLQLGYTIGVCSKDNKISGTAIFHELAHEVCQTIIEIEIDYNHTSSVIWSIVSKIENKWVTLIKE